MSVQSLAATHVSFLIALTACGSVSSPATDAAAPNGWASNCAPTAEITRVEAADAGFGNSCIHGFWYLEAFNGTTAPIAPGRPDNTTAVLPAPIAPGFNTLDSSSAFAIHVTGSGQENVMTGTETTFSYAQLTVSLNAPSDTEIGTVDASAYTGIQFYAIVNTADTGARFTVANLYTDPIGNQCTTAPGPMNCYDHPGTSLALTTTWTKYQIEFASLTQIGYGNHSPLGTAFPRSAITLLKWDIGIPDTGPTEPWELWVDDLTFY